VYIYISNEGSVQQDVFFDDFRVTHQKSPIIQANDYYPFGLTFNSYQRENSVTNQYQYNGKEMQDELGLAWLDYGARMYMSDVGRWGVIDPLAGRSFELDAISLCVQ
jgi:RHS repeat-associated protein